MKSSHIFSQAINKINFDKFAQIVAKHNGDKSAKGLKCRDILTMMLFANFSGSDSLREICNGMAMQGGNLSHLGMSRNIGPSSLSYANAHRPWEIFRDLFDYLVKEFQPGLLKKTKRGKLKNKIFSIDSTTIDLCLSAFPWAKFHHSKGAVKIHTVLDNDSLLPVFANISHGRTHDKTVLKNVILNEFALPKNSIIAMDKAYIDYELFSELTEKEIWFVSRIKKNAVYRVTKKYILPQNRNIISDEEIELTSLRGEKCEYFLRKIVVWDDIKKREIELLTNNQKLGATTIANIYKSRWQVELFFKQIKQNLKIKTFVGTSENAVKIQIYCALCSIVLLRHLKDVSDSIRTQNKQKNFSFSNIVVMLRISLFRYTALDEWLSNPFLSPPEYPINLQTKADLFGQHSFRGEG